MQPDLDFEATLAAYRRFLEHPPTSEFTRWYQEALFMKALMEKSPIDALDDRIRWRENKKNALARLKALGYQIEL